MYELKVEDFEPAVDGVLILTKDELWTADFETLQLTQNVKLGIGFNDLNCKAVTAHPNGMYVAAVCTDTVYTKGYIIMVSYLSSSPAVIGDPLEIDVINVKKAQFSGNFLIVLSDDYTTCNSTRSIQRKNR